MNTGNSMDEQFIKKITQIIEDNLQDENFSAAELAEQMGVSRVTLYRKVKSISKISASEFIREIRLKKAYQMLRGKEGTVAEISYRVGFNSPPYFNKCFHDYYDVTPGDVLKGIIPESEVEEAKEDEEKAKNAPSGQFRKATIYLLVSLSVIAVIVIIMLLQAGQKHSENQIMIWVSEEAQNDSVFASHIYGLKVELKSKLPEITNFEVKPDLFTAQFNSSENILSDTKKSGIDYLIIMSKTPFNPFLNVEMIEMRKEKLLFSNPYQLSDFTSGNYFETAKNLTTKILEFINGKIEENDKVLIAEFPSENEEAMRLYYLALDYERRFDNRLGNHYLQKAKYSLIKAIELDSTFAKAYTQLGHLIVDIIAPYERNWPRKMELLDSGLLLANQAQRFDPTAGWGLKYNYYMERNMNKKADSILDIMYTKYSKPDDANYMFEVGRAIKTWDFYGVITNFYMYEKTKPEHELTPAWMLRAINWNLFFMGFGELAKEKAAQLLQMENDTANYYYHMYQAERNNENIDKELVYLQKWYDSNLDRSGAYRHLITHYLFTHEDSIAYQLLQEWEKYDKEAVLWRSIPQLVYLYKKYNREEDAMKLYDQYQKNLKSIINSDSIEHNSEIMGHSNLGIVYASVGENEKAIKHLKIATQPEYILKLGLIMVKELQLFDGLRSDPEFQQIIKEMETKYNYQHNRIKNKLVEEGIIKM